MAGIVVISVLGLACLGFAAVLLVAVAPQNRRRRKAEREGKMLEFEEQVNSWNLAMERWNRLYYCGRDDRVCRVQILMLLLAK